MSVKEHFLWHTLNLNWIKEKYLLDSSLLQKRRICAFKADSKRTTSLTSFSFILIYILCLQILWTRHDIKIYMADACTNIYNINTYVFFSISVRFDVFFCISWEIVVIFLYSASYIMLLQLHFIFFSSKHTIKYNLHVAITIIATL